MLLNAGSDLDSSLELIAQSRTDESFKLVISELRASVRQGVLLSNAMLQQPECFDNYFVGMVRSGEASGQLAKVLEQLAHQLESTQELKNQINNALIYPAILMVAMGLSLVLVLGVILPQLTGLFESFGEDLSPMANGLLFIGQFIDAWGSSILIALAVLLLFAYLLQDQLRLKYRVIAMVTQVPLIGNLLGQIEFARFTSTLSSLLASGLTQVDALSIAAESFQQDSNRSKIEAAILEIKQGKSLSSALESVDGFGDLYAHSIQSGERAGQLPNTLSVLARRLEKDFSRRAQRLASMVEPILILSLGLVIGLIIYTVFSALQGISDIPL